MNQSQSQLDDEWSQFISSHGVQNNMSSDNEEEDDEDSNDYFVDQNVNVNVNVKSKRKVFDDEDHIMNEHSDSFDMDSKQNVKNKHHNGNLHGNVHDNEFDQTTPAPEATKIYISTKTKLAYLNQLVDLKEVFWRIPILSYAHATNGVIKKQMKFNSLEPTELDYIKHKLTQVNHYEEHVITSINNPNGRIKFKDIRKVSVGISKKDIMSYRCKKKSAFYNCFVLILRIKVEEEYKEFHVKVFNTGKVEIPGIQTEEIFQLILQLLLVTLQPHVAHSLDYKENSEETVLINSNFNCGFYINRETLYDTLRMKYNIQAILDPCSYPGIQCKFYFNPNVEDQTGVQVSKEYRQQYKNIKAVSFMIFRTGSVLIVGRCDEHVILSVYEYLKNVLHKEFAHICQKNINVHGDVDFTAFHMKEKDKVKKIRRKNIFNCESLTQDV